jgi:hypothetical protein
MAGLLSVGLSAQGQAPDATNLSNLQWLAVKVICMTHENVIGTATVVGYGREPVGTGATATVQGKVHLVTAKHLDFGEARGCTPENLRVQFPDVAGRQKLGRLTVDSSWQHPALDFQILTIASSRDFALDEMEKFFETPSCWCVSGGRAHTGDPLAVAAYSPSPADSKVQALASYRKLTMMDEDAKGEVLRYRGDPPPEGASGGPIVDSQNGLLGIELSSETDSIGTALDISAIRKSIPAALHLPWLLGDIRSSQSVSTEIISAGWSHSCRLTVDGTAYCWGNNADGQLGTGGKLPSPTPRKVMTGMKFQEISVGQDHTCAIQGVPADKKPTGDAYCWGNARFGSSSIPVAVPARFPVPEDWKQGFKSITAGNKFTCAIRGDNYHPVCWGRDFTHRDTGMDISYGIKILGPHEISEEVFLQVSAGKDHVCGIALGGGAYCWGDGWTYSASAPPKQVGSGVLGFKEGTLASDKRADGACAIIKQSDDAYCWPWRNGAEPAKLDSMAQGVSPWGDDGFLLLTKDHVLLRYAINPFANKVTVTDVQANVSQMSAGNGYGCFVDACGHPFCWGKAGGAALGVGAPPPDDKPLPLANDVN